MITLSQIIHKEETRIQLQFEYNREIIEKIKQLPTARYSASRKSWHIANTTEAYQAFLRLELPHIVVKTGTTGDFESKSDHTGIGENSSHSVIPIVV
jgi:hypothetical protein